MAGLPPLPRRDGRRVMPSGRSTLTLLLVGAFLLSLTSVEWGNRLVHPGGGASLLQFGEALVNPEISAPFLRRAIGASWQTIAFATTGLSVALLIGIPLGVVASGTLIRGVGRRRIVVAVTRFVLASLRSVHELVWAWLFVAAIGLSPMAAIFALGLNYGGILGRIYSELLADVPEAPLRSLRTSGASEWKVFLYGRLPMALPDLLSYSFYRFECGIRSAAILSFVGIAGLGFQIQLALNDLRYSEVWTLLFFLVGLVVLVDIWSSMVRRRLVS